MLKNEAIYVAGHKGLAGNGIFAYLKKHGYSNLIGTSSSELDLRNRPEVFSFMENVRPKVVIDAAARVGGIFANNTYPADFISENLQIQVNLMDSAAAAGVERFIFLGSSCIYPKFAEQPIKESALLTGPLEPTNSPYGVAKIAGILHVQSIRRQFHRNWISVMPTNLYGPNDNYHPENSHVMAALIRKIYEARESQAEEVSIWGSGTPLREFLHVEDLGSATEFLLANYDSDEPINVGTGEEISIANLARLIADQLGFSGKLVFDRSKPDGTPRKMLDSTKLRDYGWKPAISLEKGIADAFEWFKANLHSPRVNIS